MPEPKSPIMPTDDAALTTARTILDDAGIAALAVITPDGGGPFVSRIAVARLTDTAMVTLVSDLSLHTRALRADPRASLLMGEVPARGDSLAFPRLTLSVAATFVPDDDLGLDALRTLWLKRHPKSALYAGFADFHFVRFEAQSAWLNGGFGKAYVLTPEDLRLRA